MSDIDHAIYYLEMVGLPHDAEAVRSQRQELIALRARLAAAEAAGHDSRRLALLERLRTLCADLIPDDTAEEVRGAIEVDDIISCLIETLATRPSAPAQDVAAHEIFPGTSNALEKLSVTKRSGSHG